MKKVISIIIATIMTVTAISVPSTVFADSNSFVQYKESGVNYLFNNVSEYNYSNNLLVVMNDDVFNWSTSDTTYMYQMEGYIYVIHYDLKYGDFSDGYEKIKSNKLFVHKYDNSLNLLSSKTVILPMKEFGACYKGEDGYFYVAVGKSNVKSNETAIKILKYDSQWELVGCSDIPQNITFVFDGIVSPFDAGNCRMVQKDNLLIVHTSRLMDPINGVSHQSNLTLVINTDNMRFLDVYSNTYVSHSFNQFVEYDNDSNSLFFIDHGDAYPRGISVGQKNFDELYSYVTNSGYVEDYDLLFDDMEDDYHKAVPTFRESCCFEFVGSIGENYTGATVDGFEIGKNNNIIIGTSQPQNNAINGIKGNDGSYNNLYMILVDKQNCEKSNFIWLTKNDPNNSHLSIVKPRLYKVNDDEFAVFYNVKNTLTDEHTLCYRLYNSSGEELASKNYYNVAFSGCCQPILLGNNFVFFSADSKSEPIISGTPQFMMVPYVKNNDSDVNVLLENNSLSYYYAKTGERICNNIGLPLQVSYGGDYQKVTFDSSNKKVFQIKKCEIVAKKIGSANLKITVNGKTISKKIKINPQSPEIYLGSKSKNEIKINLYDSEKNLQIQYSTNKSFKKYKTISKKGKKTASVQIKNLKSKKTYYIRIRTYRSVGGKKYYSDWSDVLKVKTK